MERLNPHERLTRGFKHMDDLITQQEIQEARKELYSGKKMLVHNYRTNKNEFATIERFYTHVVCFDNGCSYTMLDIVKNLRNPNFIIGYPFYREQGEHS